jgi:hypothetical protein
MQPGTTHSATKLLEHVHGIRHDKNTYNYAQHILNMDMLADVLILKRTQFKQAKK